MPENIVLLTQERHQHSIDSAHRFDNTSWEECDALSIEYGTRCTLVALRAIADYYGIRSRGVKKADLVASLVEFETTADNDSIVSRRRGLWSAASILKEDPYFGSRLLLDC